VAIKGPTIALVALVVGMASAEAAVRVKQVMRDWKAEILAAEQMVGGRDAIDAAEMNRILTGFASNAQDISGRLTAASGADLKARFDKFAAVSQAAVAQPTTRDKARATILELRSECRSCHDAYAN
jgi:cytochrome c556